MDFIKNRDDSYSTSYSQYRLPRWEGRDFLLVSKMDESFGVDHINYSVLMSFYHGVQIFRLLFFVAICSAVCFYINYKIKRRRLEKIIDRFDGPKGYPLIGNVAEFFGPTTDVIKKGIALMKIYKSPFKIWLVHKPYVVVYTPEDFQTVAFKTMEKDSSYRFIVDMMGDGIFTSEVEKWKRHRRVINPAFNPTILFHYFLQIFNEQNINLVKRLKKETRTGKHFDYWPYESQTSVITLCEVSMGYKDINTTEVMKFGNSLTKSAELVSKRFYQPWLMPSFIFTAYRYLFGYGNVFNDVRDLPLKMLKTRRELLQRMKNEDYVCTGQEKTMRNFLDILLNFQEGNQNFSDEELADEVISIMFGGSETSSVNNSFCMLMLGMRQDIQEKVYQELHAVFGDGNRLPELEDLAKLSYLEQCIKETLRRFPVAPFVLRHTRQDIEISNGNIIPAGSNIALGIYGIHHDPNIYPNPEVWDPSNFDPENVANRHQCSFVPFSTGPRGCVAQKYAMILMKAKISTLTRNFKITTDLKMDNIELKVDMVIRNIDGYQIKLEYRHGESLF